ncbi:TerB family tellurite resistance protein [bacterium]|jgi:DnaJ like chaperone protein|nr:DnaJ-like protein [uncultured bacterium]MDA8977812.1 TerB family tellurite resistance protein [bacterium]MDA9025642.1 TerB family tellurite resistance protein [bacterium]MDA9341716.1 TerB family tellurite resistance protein [Flavobacteriaceae bacterium]MDB4127336.1 TerB family tellurite resistance protein [Flavobacteriaceae bacterium]|tara:strand:- start:87 stop:818 length:732 start_codon:yes stop_codon:yes gene_type:complete
MIRWIAAIIGYSIFRFPGAIIGFLLGSLFEGNSSSNGSRRSIFTQSKQRVSPAEFELNLLSLASLVIKADGIVNQKELDFVRQYFVQAYGKEQANATFKVFNEEIKKKQLSAQKIAAFLRNRMRYESRLQIIHFLFSVAKADGQISDPEVREINNITGFLGINHHDFESIKAMFFNNPDSAYKILEIEKTANPDQIKKAYRTMVKKYHPDKLQHMDEVYRNGAEEKFRKVQEAYEQIQKERGF